MKKPVFIFSVFFLVLLFIICVFVGLMGKNEVSKENVDTVPQKKSEDPNTTKKTGDPEESKENDETVPQKKSEDPSTTKKTGDAEESKENDETVPQKKSEDPSTTKKTGDGKESKENEQDASKASFVNKSDQDNKETFKQSKTNKVQDEKSNITNNGNKTEATENNVNTEILQEADKNNVEQQKTKSIPKTYPENKQKSKGMMSNSLNSSAPHVPPKAKNNLQSTQNEHETTKSKNTGQGQSECDVLSSTDNKNISNNQLNPQEKNLPKQNLSEFPPIDKQNPIMNKTPTQVEDKGQKKVSFKDVPLIKKQPEKKVRFNQQPTNKGEAKKESNSEKTKVTSKRKKNTEDKNIANSSINQGEKEVEVGFSFGGLDTNKPKPIKPITKKRENKTSEVPINQGEKEVEGGFRYGDWETDDPKTVKTPNQQGGKNMSLPNFLCDSLTNKIMGKAYRVHLPNDFIVDKDTYDEIFDSLTAFKDLDMLKFVKIHKVDHKNTKNFDQIKDAISLRKMENPTRVTISSLVIGCQTKSKIKNFFDQEHLFLKAFFDHLEIHYDANITKSIEKYMQEHEIIRPERFFEPKSEKFMLNPVILSQSGKIIDYSTLKTITQRNNNSGSQNTKLSVKKEDLSYTNHNVLKKQIDDFLKNMGRFKEYFEDLNYLSEV